MFTKCYSQEIEWGCGREGSLVLIHKKRILLVDDSKPITNFLTIKLKSSGYDVDAAHDGLSGLETAKRTNPNLIMLDIIMPGIDGLEVLRRLRAFSRVPVIMLSIADGVREESLRLGANEFMGKPFNLDDLMGKIAVLI
jgi:DNA-binding response OmpR family regulator